MSSYRLTLVVDVDDELLADHVADHGGERQPYTAVVAEWNGDDVFRAAEQGIIDSGEVELELVTEVAR